MAWTKSGTVSITNNSKKVFGAGTPWVSNGKTRPGDEFIAPNGARHEVESVQSNTELTLVEPYMGATASGQSYALLPLGLLPAELAVGVSEMTAKNVEAMSQLYEWETSEAATVPLRNPATGVTAQVKPLARFLSSLGDGSMAGSFTTLSASAEVTSMRQGVVSDLAYKVNGNGAWEQPNLIGHYYDGKDVTRIAVPSAYSNNAFIDLDAAGNFGIGAPPGAWGSANRAAELASGSLSVHVFDNLSSTVSLTNNAVQTGNVAGLTGWVTKVGHLSAIYQQKDSEHIWGSSAWTAHDQPITFTQDMALANGNLLVGATEGSWHKLFKSVARDAGNVVASFGHSINPSLAVYATTYDYSAANSANSAVKTGKDAVTGRSIGSPGTINASGADYAEYESNNGVTVAKGAVVGFKSDGTLTLTFAAAIRFGIKSTNPSYVGGDTWGSEEQVGKRPEQPIRKMDVTEQRIVSEAIPDVMDGDGIAIAGTPAVYETVILEPGDTDAEWAAIESTYTADLTDFEARLEAARLKVDRVAYSGKVPVNVLGATPGGYIIAVEGADGAIVGEFAADPDFAQYKRAVGRVNRILEDGRCEVAVMVH